MHDLIRFQSLKIVCVDYDRKTYFYLKRLRTDDLIFHHPITQGICHFSRLTTLKRENISLSKFCTVLTSLKLYRRNTKGKGYHYTNFF